MRRHFVSGFPRALLSLGQEKSSGVEIGGTHITSDVCVRGYTYHGGTHITATPGITRQNDTQITGHHPL